MVTLESYEMNNLRIEYNILEDSSVVGKATLRLIATKADIIPEGFQSNIYYEVSEVSRNRGVATETLRQLKTKAKENSLTELILNVMKSNTASKKVIENNGGTLIDEAKGDDGIIYQKYQINL